MAEGLRQSCRQLMADGEDDDKLADNIEKAHPACTCEAVSIGDGSPGPVANDEQLHRLVVSPRDYSPDDGSIRQAPFEKVFKNGLSVCRSVASDEDVTSMLIEALEHRAEETPREFIAACTASVAAIRDILKDGERVFCVYDQTVERHDTELPPVPTHAGVFQRLPRPRTENRKPIQKDFVGKLRELFLAGRLNVDQFRDGQFVDLNRRAQTGEFERDA